MPAFSPFLGAQKSSKVTLRGQSFAKSDGEERLWRCFAAWALSDVTAVDSRPLVPSIAMIGAVVGSGLAGLWLAAGDREGGWQRSWGFLELGIVLLAGSTLLAISEGAGGMFPSGSGFVVIAGLSLVAAGLGCHLNSRMPSSALGAIFESLMCIGAAGLVIWGALVINNHAPVATATDMLPVLADCVLLWLTVRLVFLTRSEPRGALAILAALALLLAVDALIAANIADVAGGVVPRLEAVRLVVLHAGGRRAAPHAPKAVLGAAEAAGPARRGRVAAALGLTLLAPALFALQGAAGLSPTLPVLLVGSSILPFLVGLYLVRQVQDGADAEHRAQHDPLTGLPNRVLFLDRLEVALATAQRNGYARRASCSSTSTGSRRSTTASAMRSETSCCRPSRSACSHASGIRHGRPHAAATSSWCCSRASTARPTASRRREAAQRLCRSVRASGRAGRHEHEHRHRHLPGQRPPTPTPLIEERRHRDVPRQGERHATPFSSSRRTSSARAQVRHSLESSLRGALERRRARAVLPAQDRLDDTSDRRARGVRPLAITRSSVSCRRTPSSRSQKRPGSSCRSGTGCSTRPAARSSEWSALDLRQFRWRSTSRPRSSRARQTDRGSRSAERNGLSPDLLELEITESSFTARPCRPRAEALHNLRDIGVRCSIDDFGTGYSGSATSPGSRLYSLKIDQSFVRRIGSSVDGEQIVHAVITLARSFG